MNWAELEIFEGIDLHDSFVLSWEQVEDVLGFQLDASIWPASSHYATPKPNEYTCYKSARLVFSGFKDISGLKDVADVLPATDANGEVDYGCIDNLEILKNGFRIEGDFGSVAISGGKMSVEIKT